MLGRVRGIASDGGRRLWALRSDGRTVLRLDPVSGRLRYIGRAARPASRLALTRHAVWLASDDGATLQRIGP